MIKAGITGSIGSGKTTVCKAFEALGIHVYYADTRAREILEENKKIISAVKKLLGKDIYNEKGKLKRKEVAKIVFSNKKILKQYNHIIHPVVLKDFETWAKKNAHHAYILKEAALLFEAGADKGLYLVICVTAPEKLRIQRVMQRDGVQKADVMRRMKNQMSQKEKISRSHLQIRNDGKVSLVKQVYLIHEVLLGLSNKKITSSYKKNQR